MSLCGDFVRGCARTMKRWIRAAGTAAVIGVLALAAALLAPITGHDVNVAEGPLTAPTNVRLAPSPVRASHLSLDGRFVAELALHGASQFDATTGKNLAVANAQVACFNVEHGESWRDQAQEVLNGVVGYDQQRADLFVELALETYCPEAWHS